MNVDPIARAYRWIEYAAFGRALERSRFCYLDRLAHARRILVLGEGDGRALARLMDVAPQAEVDVIELGAEMIRLARSRAGNSERVRFRNEDVRSASLPFGHYDGVVSFFFLDCFDEDGCRGVIRKIRDAMTMEGLWLVTDFAIPDDKAGLLRWRNLHARILIRIMYKFFGITTGLRIRSLPPISGLLREAGLDLVERTAEREGLIRSEVWKKSESESRGLT